MSDEPIHSAAAGPEHHHAAASSASPAGLPELVRFDKVTKSFGEGAEAKVAVQDVSFVVHDLPNVGELVAIVGPSGCGKSTVLRMLAGLRPHFPPTSGSVIAFGQPIAGPAADRGMVDQKYSLMPHLTVLENIAFGLKLRGLPAKERRDRAHTWALKVGLDGAEDKYPFELSGGMQQRVSIAATLILQPKILLMDEPFGALDAFTRDDMNLLIQQIWMETGKTIAFVTHSIPEAIFLADRIVIMSARPGRVASIYDVDIPRPRPVEIQTQPDFIARVMEIKLRIDKQRGGPVDHSMIA